MTSTLVVKFACHQKEGTNEIPGRRKLPPANVRPEQSSPGASSSPRHSLGHAPGRSTSPHPTSATVIYRPRRIIPTLAVVKMLAQRRASTCRSEVDEYLRAQLVRAILVGITFTLVASSFSDFLASYDHGRGLPPFTLFTICWVVTGIAQSVQSHRNRVRDEEGAR